MHDKMAINWIVVFWVLVSIMLLGGVFFSIYSQEVNSSDQLQYSYKINNNLWLYITENREGNATVPIINRFYMSEKIVGNDNSITNELENKMPFITGSGTISQVSVSDDYNIAITYSGKVTSLSDSISYLVNGQQINAHLSYSIN